MHKSVLVALSGGIDSSVAAFLLRKEGYKVVGIHFIFFPEETDQQNTLNTISDSLDIPVIRYDARELFSHEVIDYFIRYHLSGLTPGPCSYCNPNVKYRLLLQMANKYKIPNIATGHYIRLKKKRGKIRIYKGINPEKDQSYYLWGLNHHILDKLIAPLGTYDKKRVIETAATCGLDFLAQKKESSGLCFAKGKAFEKVLKEYIPDLEKKINSGDIINKEGEKIGRHKGYIYYTIGQKRGLEMDVEDNLCVVKIDAKKNTLIVDNWESLFSREFSIADTHFINHADLKNAEGTQVKIRGFGLNPPGNCHLDFSNKYTRVYLDEPAWALAPGQPAVFYSDDLLLGGGIII